MPNTIYSSEKVMPYAYLGIHQETGQFYFGYRAANKLPSSCDLGFKYFTSSKKVKELGFENFDWIILAEFFDKKFAFDFEQQLILDNISSDKCINQYVNGNFYSDNTGLKMTEETKKQMSETRKGTKNGMFGVKRFGEENPFFGKTHSIETREILSKRRKGKTKETDDGVRRMANSKTGKKLSQAHKEKLKLRPATLGFSGHNHSDETRAKMSESRLGKPCPSANVICPHCGKEGAKRNLTRYHFNNCKLLRF